MYSGIVAIGYELRLSTKGVLANVHAVISSRSKTKVSSFLFVLGLFYLSVVTLSIYFRAFSFLHSRLFVCNVTFL